MVRGIYSEMYKTNGINDTRKPVTKFCGNKTHHKQKKTCSLKFKDMSGNYVHKVLTNNIRSK